MTASPKPPAAVPGSQLRVPDFFIVGARQERHDRAVRDAAPPPADLHARLQGALFLASDLRASLPAADRAVRRRRRSRSTSSLFADAEPEQRVGEASSLLPVVAATAATHIAEARSPARASSRSCASPRASCARCTCSCCRTTSRRSRICARRSRSRATGAKAGISRAARYRPQALLLLGARALRRAVAPLPRACSRAEQVLVLIYDDFQARQRGDGAHGCCAFSRSTTRLRSRCSQANPTVRRALPAARRAGARRIGGDGARSRER